MTRTRFCNQYSSGPDITVKPHRPPDPCWQLAYIFCLGLFIFRGHFQESLCITMKPASPKLFVRATLLLVMSLCWGNLKANDADEQVSAPTNVGEPKADGAARAIQWRDLAPENGKPFLDPFTKLSSDQIVDLSYVVRVRRLIADDKIEAGGEDAKEAAALASQLERQGVDIGWLMVQRGRVQQIRSLQVERQAKAIAESLQDQRVSLTGYVIPITFDETRLTEFFLVPTIAACSHEDAPPRLQVVFIATEQGIANPGRRTPVRVSGKIVAETTTSGTFNANGRVSVHSAYLMSSPEINVFQAAREAESRPNQ